jgi:SH3 domain-containing YSC84-like protein 1
MVRISSPCKSLPSGRRDVVEKARNHCGGIAIALFRVRVRTKKENEMRSTIGLLTLAMIVLPASAGDTASRESERLQRADAVLKASLDAPDKGVPLAALKRAECVGVFPDVKKGAFVVGGEGGSGVFTCRDKNGEMGAPAFFKIGGGSVGWQFGGQETDLVLLVMNDEGMKHLLADHFTIGAAATATGGPVGRTAEAATDAQMHAQILSWSRSQGAFIGAALEGGVISTDEKANLAVYGKDVSARSILLEHKVKPTPEATAFLRTLNAKSDRG